MARLHETVETKLPADQAFAFIADFSNSERWDPGTAWSKPVKDPTPRIGAAYLLGVRMGGRVAPMTYEIVALEPGERVILRGSGSNVSAVDDIKFSSTPTGTLITYTADIELTGLLRLAAPFTGRAFASIARNARDGMQRALDELARVSQPVGESVA